MFLSFFSTHAPYGVLVSEITRQARVGTWKAPAKTCSDLVRIKSLGLFIDALGHILGLGVTPKRGRASSPDAILATPAVLFLFSFGGAKKRIKCRISWFESHCLFAPSILVYHVQLTKQMRFGSFLRFASEISRCCLNFR